MNECSSYDVLKQSSPNKYRELAIISTGGDQTSRLARLRSSLSLPRSFGERNLAKNVSLTLASIKASYSLGKNH